MGVNETLTRIETEVNTQESLIGQIQTALAGKMAGGGTTLKDFLERNEIDVVDSTATTLASNALYYYSNLKSIDLANVESVGSSACYSCSHLTRVNLPKAQNIGVHAFYSCTKLSELSADAVIKIDQYAFTDGWALTSLYFPNVTEIGRNAFQGCYNVNSVYMPNLITTGVYSFQRCTKLNDISLPNVTYLQERMFDSAGMAGNVRLDSMTACGGYSFSSSKIESVDFPALKKVELYAFYNCKSLVNVVGREITEIQTCAFYGCTVLTTVDLHKIITLGSQVFRNCTALEHIIIRNTDAVATYNNTTASYDPANENLKIYVPRSLVDSYKTAANWSRLAEKIVALEDYTNDGTTTGAVIG